MATPALILHALVAIAAAKLAAYVTAAAASDDVACLQVNPATNRIVDSSGRERYFHGVNVVMKGPPWLPAMDKFDPIMSFVEEDMQLLQNLGLNAIRYVCRSRSITLVDHVLQAVKHEFHLYIAAGSALCGPERNHSAGCSIKHTSTSPKRS